MQFVTFRPQQIDGANANLQMLGDRPFIETVGLARQLNFAVQRLIGDAQQRAVRDAEAIPCAAMVALSISIATARLRLNRSAEAE
jgi:hypothetical protein